VTVFVTVLEQEETVVWLKNKIRKPAASGNSLFMVVGVS